MNWKEDIAVILAGALFAGAFYQYVKGYRPINGGDPTRAMRTSVSMGVRG